MRLSILLFLPLGSVFAESFQVQPRQVQTFAQTCSYYGTSVGGVTTSTLCNTPAPTVSGPYVTINCLGLVAALAFCNPPSTAVTCTPTTTTSRNTVLGIVQTTVVVGSACTPLIFAPLPVSATTTTSSRPPSTSGITTTTRSTTTVSSTSVPAIISSSTVSSSSTSVTATIRSSTVSSSSTSVTVNTGSSTVPISSTTVSTTTSSSTAPVDTTCFADNINGQGRTFASASNSSDSMTNGLCQSYCNNLGFAYSGTEYRSECYCSQTAPTVRSSGCTLTCSAAGSTEICGGENALSVRFNSAVAAVVAQAASVASIYTSQGCYSDHYPTRVLSGASSTATTMSVVSCINFCNTQGFTLAGVENYSECYCGNTILSDGTSYGIGGQAGCTFACSGNPADRCGGSNVLNLYNRGPSVATSSATTSTTSTTASASPTALNSFAGYTFVGCYLDGNIRTLTQQLPDVGSIESCITGCSNAGYRFAGLEYYSQCFCDNQIVNNGPTVISTQNCNYRCSGNSSQSCGGANAVQIYFGTPVTPSVSILSGSQGYNYMDTFVDSTSSRILPVNRQVTNTTVESCITSCASAGYSYAGVEYAAECYCGSAMDSNAVGGQTPTMPCQGKAANYCGGPNAIQIYVGTPPPPPTLSIPFTNGQCVTDNINNTRSLSGPTSTGTNMTSQVCRTFCQGYIYFGVEYSSECYCGSSLPVRLPLSSACTFPCAGNSAQICGGPNALTLYNS